MKRERLRHLLELYEAGTITAAEKEELFAAFVDVEMQEDLLDLLVKSLETTELADAAHHVRWQNTIGQILRHKENDQQQDETIVSATPHPKTGSQRWWYAAAAVLLIISAALYLIPDRPTNTAPIAVRMNAAVMKDVLPANGTAILTLADGSTIVLDSANNGLLALQGKNQLTKKGNQVMYSPSHTQGQSVVYNELRTNKGKQYSLVLPDGTKVWLNAESSIKYPVAFVGKERTVFITGEAYFEVAKNPAMPFRVYINEDMSVAVLGTHFNINAYADEPHIETSLSEGSIMVSRGDSEKRLKPGQQLKTSKNGGIGKISEVDMEEVLAWKNGTFFFRDADIEAVMRQLSRWYNVQVTYKSGIPPGQFSGEIGRNLTLQQVLEGLADTRINFQIDRNTITILPEE
jgi:ferric-dicitrate binding protein FerR (iron transport regulator)